MLNLVIQIHVVPSLIFTQYNCPLIQIGLIRHRFDVDTTAVWRYLILHIVNAAGPDSGLVPRAVATALE